MLLIFTIIPKLLVLAVIVALIYLIVKRIADKKDEDFEKRDN